MPTWEAPTFVEIKMDAELTAYVEDLERDSATLQSDSPSGEQAE
jgi:hypothetical protein